MKLDTNKMIENVLNANENFSKEQATQAVFDLTSEINTAPLRHLEINSNAPYWFRDLGFDESRPYVVISSGLYGGMGSSRVAPLWVSAVKANRDMLKAVGLKIHSFSEGGGIGGFGIAIAIQTDKIDTRYNELVHASTI